MNLRTFYRLFGSMRFKYTSYSGNVMLVRVLGEDVLRDYLWVETTTKIGTNKEQVSYNAEIDLTRTTLPKEAPKYCKLFYF